MTATINHLEKELDNILEAIDAIEIEIDDLDLNHFAETDYEDRRNVLCEQRTSLCAKSKEVGKKLDSARGELLKNSPIFRFFGAKKA